jgi:hypothetical protein
MGFNDPNDLLLGEDIAPLICASVPKESLRYGGLFSKASLLFLFA